MSEQEITGEVIGERIRKAREAAGLNQKEAAAAADMNLRNYQHYEAGRKLASIPVLVRIANALGATWEELLPEVPATRGE